MRVLGRVFVRLLHALYRQRVPVLLILVLGLSAGTYFLWRNMVTEQLSAAGELPVEVTMQPLQQQGANITLTLKEKSGNRRLSMNIGQAEALVIARERGQAQRTGDQLQAYDLLRDVIEQLGGRVDRVVINDANQQQYFAQVIVSPPGGESKVVRAKPADAMALAVKTGAPIFVEDRVLERFGSKG